MSVFKATKKPVTIEAIQYKGMVCAVASFVGDALEKDDDGLFIRTIKGNMRVSVGDYIIKGVQGEFYPCKPDIFKATYNYRCKCGEDISFESVGCIYCKN